MRLIFGLLTGVIAGLLLAPDSGRKTREKINNEFPKYKKQANDTLHDAVEKAKSAYSELVSELGLATETEKQANAARKNTASNHASKNTSTNSVSNSSNSSGTGNASKS